MKKVLVCAIIPLIFTGCNNGVGISKNDSDNSTSKYSLLMSGTTDFVDIRVQKFYRYVYPSRPDHMSDPTNTTIPGYTNEGPFWYILPNSSPFSGIPIYRMFLNGDHMTSKVPCTPGTAGEGGYNCEYQMGKLLGINDPTIGLFPVNRYHSTGANLDHLDAGFGEIPANYSNDGTLGYAWMAKNQPNHVEQSRIDVVSANGITIGTSLAWGGSIVSLTKNSNEYINRYDAGRELQSANHMYLADNSLDNPTEAGDKFGNGSPIMNYDLNYLGVAGRVHTRTLSMRWGETDNLAPAQESPIISGTEIGKDVTIINPNRILYNSWFVYDKTFQAPVGGLKIIDEEAVAYLRNIFDNLKNFEWNPATSNFVQKSTLPGHGAGQYVPLEDPITHTGYAIAYTNDGSKAFAILNKAAISDSISLSIVTCSADSPENGSVTNPTVRLSIYRRRGSITRGNRSDYTNYILVGTKAEVETEALYLATH